jgi:hypothetical protein
MSFAGKGMGLEIYRLNEISHTERGRCYMFFLMCCRIQMKTEENE